MGWSDTDMVAGVFSAFAFPAVALSQLIVEKRPSVAMGGAAATSYYVYDGTATGLVFAYLAAGTVFAVLDRGVLKRMGERALQDAEKRGESALQRAENQEKAKFCKEHPTLGKLLGFCSVKLQPPAKGVNW